MSESGRIFEITELSVSKPGAAMPELDRFSLSLGAGESVVVLGEAGSGKEALMRVLGGFAERADAISGTIRFGNGEVRPAAKRLPPRIAHIHDLQHPADADGRAIQRLPIWDLLRFLHQLVEALGLFLLLST